MINASPKIIACIIFFSIMLNVSLFAGGVVTPYVKDVSSLGIFKIVIDTAAPISAVNELVKKIVLNEEIGVPQKHTEKSDKNEKKSVPLPGVNLFSSHNSEKTGRYIKASSDMESYLSVLSGKTALPELAANAPPGNLIIQITFIFLIIYLAILFRDSWAKILLSISKKSAAVF